MSAGKYSFCIFQGSTFERNMTYSDENGTAVDLTGATIRMQARKTVDSATPLIDISTDASGITITSAVDGEFQILLTAAETTALDFKTAVYDLEVEFPSGEVRRVLEGIIEFRKEVTR